MRIKTEIFNLANEIKKSSKDNPVEHKLETSERVLKRITDGIYRQPSSALRELISNSFDADATKVIIETDYPRFNRISIRDNGNGFTEEALASLICSIGGSPKRTLLGADMGITDKRNPDLSPGGRVLIGKIGIGLFAVSQLTKEFQIITKIKGANHQTIAHIKLNIHSEDKLRDKAFLYETGISRIWKRKSSNKNFHGTEIILLNLLNETKKDLSTNYRWLQIQPNNYLINENDKPFPPPKYHIGCVYQDENDKINKKANLPWDKNDSAKNKFSKLIKCIQSEIGVNTGNPKLIDLFDNYLNLLWTLGLQIPVPYLEKHPFEISGKDNIPIYKLGNFAKSKAEKIKLKNDEKITEKLKLKSLKQYKKIEEFDVYIDGVQIFRPILFENLKITTNAIKTSLLFIGKWEPDLKHIPDKIRGGDLEFEGYLFWQPKVVPVEHRGVLIRINNSNGTLFDETFMKYPISEQTRKNQITAEIFVLKGMDAALNVDRESFNYSHPHFQYLTKWIHNAFRQFATAHKKLGSEIREKNKREETKKKTRDFDKFVISRINRLKSEDELIEVEIIDDSSEKISIKRMEGKQVYNSKNVLPTPRIKKVTEKKKKTNVLSINDKIKAIAEILTAYGVFDEMPYDKQESLLNSIAEVIAFED